MSAPLSAPQRIEHYYDQPTKQGELTIIGQAWDPEVQIWFPIVVRTAAQEEQSRLLDLQYQKDAGKYNTASDLDEECDQVHKNNEFLRRTEA